MLDQSVPRVHAGYIGQSEGPEFGKIQKRNLLQGSDFVVVDLSHRVIRQRRTLDVVDFELRVKL